MNSLRPGRKSPRCHVNTPLVVQRRQRNVQKTVQSCFYCCQSKPITFLPFSFPSPSSLLKLLIEVSIESGSERIQDTIYLYSPTTQATMRDKIKWNRKPPSSQIKDEATRRAKTRHFPIFDFGGGRGSRFTNYFVQDCRFKLPNRQKYNTNI